MATTQTILVSGTYNGTHTGGPFNVPAGTRLIEIDTNVTDAPPGANFRVEGDVSSDGGATWQQRFVLECPGGTVTTARCAAALRGLIESPAQTSGFSMF